MIRTQFFYWAEAQDGRYELDDFLPVALTGGNINHERIAFNIHTALRNRLRGSLCLPLSLDTSVATIGDTVRSPDGVQIAVEFRDLDGHRLEIYWGIDQVGSEGRIRPREEWKGARSLEQAIADPVVGQDTSLRDPSILAL